MFCIFFEFIFISGSVKEKCLPGNRESGVSLRFFLEEPFLYNPVAAQNLNPAGRLWRQVLLAALFSLTAGTAGSIIIKKYIYYGFHYQKIFHNLIVSFSLGGCAPPQFV